MSENNLSGKIVVLTGATSGIGLATSIQLASAGAFVLGVGRSEDRCRIAGETVRKTCCNAKIFYLVADLSSIKQIKELAVKIKDKLIQEGKSHVDALINNAGTVSSWYKSTEDGFELQFAVNHLAPFLLTHELLPLLAAASESRVITVSSGSHNRTKMNWKDILLRKHYNCLAAYKQSKLANVLFCTEFNRRLGPASGITAFAIDPGLVNTQIGFKGTSGIVRWVWQKRSHSGIDPANAAASIVFLAGEPSLSNTTQVYWKECKPLKPSSYSQREDEALRLWELSEKMCGISSSSYGIGFRKKKPSNECISST